MAVHGDDFVCLSDDAGLKHIDSLLKSKYTAKDMGTLGFEDSDAKSRLWLNRVCRVGADQTGQYLDIEPYLRHAPLIIRESRCNTNTKAVSTPREKLQEKLVLDGRRSPILNRDDATRYRSACVRLSYLAQDRLDLAETREFDFVPLKRAARYLVGKPKAALRFRRQKHVDKITVFVDSDFAEDPVSRKSTTGLVAHIGNHTVKSVSTLQSLTALSVGEAEFYAVVKGGQVGLSLRSTHRDLGIEMTIEIQSDSSTANSLTDRFGSSSEGNTLTRGTFGYKNEFKRETSVSRRCFQRRTAQMLERSQVSASVLQKHCKSAGLVFHWPWIPHSTTR